VRTAGLLYGRVCAIRLCAPNGIRTRVAALKGRNPRPLDDGGPVRAAPRPRPGGSAGKYSGDPAGFRPPGRSAVRDDPESVPGEHVDALGALKDVSDPGPWEQEPPRRDRPGTSDDQVAVEQRGHDGEPHAECVDRPGAVEEEGCIRGQGRVPTQSSHPLTPGLGDERSKDETPRTEKADLTHLRTVSPPRDITAAP
jgi:hypothetical protein